jgi:hypothetical protein
MKGEIAHFERTGPRAGSSKREGNSRERIGVDAGAGNEDAQNPIEIRMADPDNGETKHLADNTDKTSPKFAATAEQVRAAPRSRTPDEEMRQDEEAAAQRKAAEDEGTGPLLESSTDAGGGHARATSSFSLSPSLPPSLPFSHIHEQQSHKLYIAQHPRPFPSHCGSERDQGVGYGGGNDVNKMVFEGLANFFGRTQVDVLSVCLCVSLSLSA